MRMPDGRIVTAGDFVPVIEQLGFIRLIDRYVLEMALGGAGGASRRSSSASTSPA